MRLSAPAKLTVSLKVVGRRSDGYHLLDAEMVSIDLVDDVEFSAGRGVEVVDEVVGGLGVGGLDGGPDNLVTRALQAVGRSAAVRVVKRIPLGAGLGGGSADAGAVLRWAGCADLSVASRLGSDVPFCVRGGRARVSGAGEQVEDLPYEERRYLLLLPPIAVDTGAVYRAHDAAGGEPTGEDNDLERAALVVEPRLAFWRAALGDLVGATPTLAGSGAAWFVALADAAAVPDVRGLSVDGQWGPLIAVGAVRAASLMKPEESRTDQWSG